MLGGSSTLTSKWPTRRAARDLVTAGQVLHRALDGAPRVAIVAKCIHERGHPSERRHGGAIADDDDAFSPDGGASMRDVLARPACCDGESLRRATRGSQAAAAAAAAGR